MKRSLVVLMAMFFAGMAVSAQAANVTFNPGSVALTIEPGNSAVADLVVTADSATGYTIYLRVGSVLGPDSNMPASWLNPAELGFVSRGGASSSRISLVVSIPADTPGGRYTAMITPEVIQATQAVDSGGVAVTVDVPSQKKCASLPAFKNVTVGPQNIWAPKNRKVEIDISGTVVVDPGCEVTGTYEMESNRAPVTGKLALDPGGNFAQKITITMSRHGKDRDGKVYNGKLSVVDAEGGWVTQGFFVKVDHDRGKKKGHDKNWKKSWKNLWHRDR